ncbi:MAG: helix-turn-helix domain-containing protein [Christensenellaceae bacterium]
MEIFRNYVETILNHLKHEFLWTFSKKYRTYFRPRMCNSDFAKLVGVSKDVISRAVLYGIIPSVRSLIKIADFLNISLEFLLAETDNPYFYKAEQPTTSY